MPEEGFDTAACIERIHQGDEASARALMERLYPLVIKLVRAYLPRRTSEEDLAQTVFMKIFANLGQYSGNVPLEHWVSRIAVNTCINELKAEKVRPELRWSDVSEEAQHVLESLTATEGDLLPSQSYAAKELVEQMLVCLEPEDRLVISLLHLEERSVAEIRKLTGWSTPLIKVRAFRARRKLRAIYAKLFEGRENG